MNENSPPLVSFLQLSIFELICWIGLNYFTRKTMTDLSDLLELDW